MSLFARTAAITAQAPFQSRNVVQPMVAAPDWEITGRAMTNEL
jgi:hypothetical protein